MNGGILLVHAVFLNFYIPPTSVFAVLNGIISLENRKQGLYNRERYVRVSGQVPYRSRKTSGLARWPQIFIWGSLIPRPTFVIGRVAIQSASRGGKIVQYTTDYRMAFRWTKSPFSAERFMFLFTDRFRQTRGREMNMLPIIGFRRLRTVLLLRPQSAHFSSVGLWSFLCRLYYCHPSVKNPVLEYGFSHQSSTTFSFQLFHENSLLWFFLLIYRY